MKDSADQSTLELFDEIKRKILGKVQIESEPPGLDIYFDGSMIGKTPKQIDNVRTGKHTIKVAGESRVINVEADRLGKEFFIIKKPENVRNTKCYGAAIDNDARLTLSYKDWLMDLRSFNINLGIRGLASRTLLFTFSVGYLKHNFPDYIVPRSIVWGGEIDWNAISITGETQKVFSVGSNTVLSFVIGSEYYFKRSPISLNTMVHIRLARFDANLDPIFDMSFYPIFSCGINFFK